MWFKILKNFIGDFEIFPLLEQKINSEQKSTFGNILPQNVISFFSWVFPSIFKYHSRIERRYYNIYILHYGQFFILNPPKNSVFYGLIYSMHFFSVVIFTHFRFISFDRVAKNQWSTRWIDFYYHALGHLWPKKHSKLT